MSDRPEKFVGEPTSRGKVLCATCKWRVPGSLEFCAAFPKGIPNEIRAGHVKHDHPIEGDHGLQYEEASESGDAGWSAVLKQTLLEKKTEKFVGEPVSRGIVLCASCKWRVPGSLEFCAAFPKGIPVKIQAGHVKHDHAIEGDHGITYSPQAS